MRQPALELGEITPYRVHNLQRAAADMISITSSPSKAAGTRGGGGTHLMGDDVAPAALRRDDDRLLGPAGCGHGTGSGRRRGGGGRGGGELTPDGGPPGAAWPSGGAGGGGKWEGEEGGRRQRRRGRCRLHDRTWTWRRRGIREAESAAAVARDGESVWWRAAVVFSFSFSPLCGSEFCYHNYFYKNELQNWLIRFFERSSSGPSISVLIVTEY
jgi:hypothetical protein